MENNPPAPPGIRNVVLRPGGGLPFVVTTGGVTLESVGGRWAACDHCKELVQSRMDISIAIKATYQFLKNHPEVSGLNFSDILSRISAVQQAFWKNWDGLPAERIVGELS
jgi:hypothetical protein